MAQDARRTAHSQQCGYSARHIALEVERIADKAIRQRERRRDLIPSALHGDEVEIDLGITMFISATAHGNLRCLVNEAAPAWRRASACRAGNLTGRLESAIGHHRAIDDQHVEPARHRRRVGIGSQYLRRRIVFPAHGIDCIRGQAKNQVLVRCNGDLCRARIGGAARRQQVVIAERVIRTIGQQPFATRAGRASDRRETTSRASRRSRSAPDRPSGHTRPGWPRC